jgi:hypothetical protein
MMMGRLVAVAIWVKLSNGGVLFLGQAHSRTRALESHLLLLSHIDAVLAKDVSFEASSIGLISKKTDVAQSIVVIRNCVWHHQAA